MPDPAPRALIALDVAVVVVVMSDPKKMPDKV
jgi:hypothetical protein